MIRLYGIPHCDTMKKARHWLDEHGIAYEFHDYINRGWTRPCCEPGSPNWAGSG
jgi:arsenate reductase-like glutaredoxin family protein